MHEVINADIDPEPIGPVATARLLWENGADPNAVNQYGFTPAEMIVPGYNKKMFNLLRKHMVTQQTNDWATHSLRAVDIFHCWGYPLFRKIKPHVTSHDKLSHLWMSHGSGDWNRTCQLFSWSCSDPIKNRTLSARNERCVYQDDAKGDQAKLARSWRICHNGRCGKLYLLWFLCLINNVRPMIIHRSFVR